MARGSHRSRSRAHHPTVGALAVPFIRESRAGRRYTAKWHRVRDWAERQTELPGFDRIELSRGKYSDRVHVEACASVMDLRDEEEAFQRGLPLEELEILDGPPAKRGGRRRVTITALTWTVEEGFDIGFDPAWITLGQGLSAHVASERARRFIRAYIFALSRGVESRRLIVTALEMKLWTAHANASYT